MTQRYQFRRPFGRHNSCDPGYRQHITLGIGPVDYLRQGRSLHRNFSSRNGASLGNFFATDVDHVRFTALIEMGQFLSLSHRFFAPLPEIGYCSHFHADKAGTPVVISKGHAKMCLIYQLIL